MLRLHERGRGNVGCIVSLAVLAIAIVLAFKVVPKRLAVADLQDFCEKEAENGSYPRFTEDRMAYDILEKAQELHLPVSKEDVKVDRGQQEINIDVRYRVTFDLIVTNYVWDVEHKVNRPRF